MQKQRLTFIVGGFFIIASIWISPALADMFYYRDVQGQLHLTNVKSRIPADYRSQADRNRRREQGGPTQEIDVSTQRQAVRSLPPRQAGKVVQRPAITSPHASPVSVRAFGLLSLRMSDFEVLQRLGPPAAISDLGLRALAPAGSSNRAIHVSESTQTWYYPGTARTPATRLEFQGGTLVNKFRLDR